MPRKLRSSGCLLVIALVGCQASAGGGGARTQNQGVARWSGGFKQSQMAASAVVGPATPNSAAAFGSITVTPVEGAPNRARVELSISAPMANGRQLAWALFTGSCGAPTPPLAGPNEFPLIDVGNNGSGMVRTTMSITLDPHSDHHANIYQSGRVSDVSNVLMCANLAYSGAR